MPAVAKALASDLSALQPAHAAYFQANARSFDTLAEAVARGDRAFEPNTRTRPVATTEPVGDYMLQAAGTDNLTPLTLQADIMNGVDPAPQSVSCQDGLFSQHKVKVFVYNQQVTDSLTESFLERRPRERASRSSASTRRCRPPATTTSPGCSPR